MTNANTQKFRLISDILKIRERIRNERAKERSLNARMAALSDEPIINLTDDMENMQTKLLKVLPKHMVPRNVGELSQVMWPFWYEFQFDYQNGANSTFTVGNRQEDTAQVSQEAGFIWTHWYRDFNDAGQAGFGAPLEVTVRDRQSSRQFNDEPTLIQHLGCKGEPTKLPTPLVIMPNARITMEVAVSSMMTNNITVVNSNGAVRIVMSGYRMRMEDAQRVIEQVFL